MNFRAIRLVVLLYLLQNFVGKYKLKMYLIYDSIVLSKVALIAGSFVFCPETVKTGCLHVYNSAKDDLLGGKQKRREGNPTLLASFRLCNFLSSLH